MAMKKLGLTLRICFVLIVLSLSTYAQDLPPEDEDDVPVYGGIFLLITAASVWGIRKINGGKN